MKKIPITLFIVSALLFILPEKTEAQSLKDILKSETAQKSHRCRKGSDSTQIRRLAGDLAIQRSSLPI